MECPKSTLVPSQSSENVRFSDIRNKIWRQFFRAMWGTHYIAGKNQTISIQNNKHTFKLNCTRYNYIFHGLFYYISMFSRWWSVLMAGILYSEQLSTTDTLQERMEWRSTLITKPLCSGNFIADIILGPNSHYPLNVPLYSGHVQ